MKRIIIQLEPNKTVELGDFEISGSNTVKMSVLMVELDIRVNYFFDFSGYPEWKKQNPAKTWRDYVKVQLLNLFDSFELSKKVKDMLDAEASE